MFGPVGWEFDGRLSRENERWGGDVGKVAFDCRYRLETVSIGIDPYQGNLKYDKWSTHRQELPQRRPILYY